MYHNSSFNTNNPNPLIPREQNYVIERKLVSIHSEDRDITKYLNANKFAVTLPQPLTNVQSLRLVQSTFPIDYYTFSIEYQNTKFRFSVKLIGGGNFTPYCVTIQEGTYTPCQLAQELTNVMNNAVNSVVFNVFYDVVGNRFWFGSVDSYEFTLDFDCKMEYPELRCEQPIVWYNYARWGLPYYLGYAKKQYVATLDVMEINYIPPTSGGLAIKWMIPIEITKVINIGGEKDIYMEVEKYNSYDEIYPFTESNKNAYDNNAYNGKVNSAFAKIPLDPITGNQDSRNVLLINFVHYEPPIERINKLEFTFRFHDGRLVDFRGLEFNFTIEFNMLRNEIVRTKNIRIPAMISL
jgi:hypothetical protein